MPHFPVVHSTLSAQHLCPMLHAAYDLSEQVTCKLFRTGMNHLYQVADGSNRYVLRVYTFGWHTRKEIDEEVRLLNHLKSHGVAISYAIADKDGEYVQEIDAPEGIRYAVLFSFARGGKSPGFSAAISRQVGVSMAQMHKASEHFSMNRATYDERTLLTDPLLKTCSFFTQPFEEITYIKTLTAYLSPILEQVKTSDMRHGAVHLDIWFDNMHFDSEDVTIFDFDFAGNGWQCLDVAYFMYQLYATNINEQEYREKADSFLSGYESITKITDEEKRIMPYLSLCIMLFYISMQCDRFDVWTNVFLNEHHLKRYVGGMKKWVNYNKLPLPVN